ncbi:MAG TPA: hypothetical protein VMH36_25750 [Alphaproteobacteria bacterium]|nr:hypothetical protein [Alphaproteobacteria bacterium]
MKTTARALLTVAGLAAGSLVSGCSDLPYNEEVRQKCANVPADQKQSCEDAEYKRLYEIERYRNRRIGGDG